MLPRGNETVYLVRSSPVSDVVLVTDFR